MSKPVTCPDWAWKNGVWLPLAQAGPSLADAGWVQGATITDLLRTHGGHPFLLEEHLERFFSTCLQVGITPRWGRHELVGVVQELLVRNQVGKEPAGAWCVVLLATPGALRHFNTGEEHGATQIVHGYPLPVARYQQWFRTGGHLVASSVPAALAGPLDPRWKHRSRLHWWLAEQKAPGGTIPVLLTPRGEVTETALAHVAGIFSRNGQPVLVLPPESWVLAGVSARLLVRLAGELGLNVARQPFTWDELAQADEILLTGSAFGLCGVSRVGESPVNWPGNWTKFLQTAWSAQAGEPLAASFD